MLLFLAGAIALVAGVVARHADEEHRREVILVGGIALGLRVLAVTTVYLIAIQTHGTGVWLSDEASFYLASESLLPDPLHARLPVGLDHLAGNAYLGVTTLIAMVVGMDTTSFRLTNAALGTCVPIVGMLVAERLFGRRQGLAVGIALAVFPA